MKKTSIIESTEYFNPRDISETCCRAVIYDYHPEAPEPIVFRHYTTDIISQGTFGSINGRKYYAMFFYIAGDLGFITNNHVYNLSYGDIFISKNNIPFLSRNATDSTLDFYEIDLPPDFFELVPNADFFRNVFHESDGSPRHFLSLNVKQRESCISRLQKTEELLSENDAHSGIIAYSYIIQIFRILNENALSANIKISAPTNAPACVINALEYIHSNFNTIKGVDEVSEHCHVSTSYLSRTFKNVLNSTINSCILNKRISHSKFLLKAGHSVTSACFESGFNDYSYFIKTFKKIVGMTPLKYKQTVIE